MNENPFQPSDATPQQQVLPPNQILVIARGVAGGIVGGVIGFYLFKWLAQQGLYGMMIPGAMMGLGSTVAARGRSLMLGVLCAAAAIGLSILAEWAVFPFVKDKSLSFFLAHVHHVLPVHLIMIALGVAFAFWLGQGR